MKMKEEIFRTKDCNALNDEQRQRQSTVGSRQHTHSLTHSEVRDEDFFFVFFSLSHIESTLYATYELTSQLKEKSTDCAGTHRQTDRQSAL